MSFLQIPPHHLQPGDEVVAKFHGYREHPDGPNNPWFSGTVAETDEDEGVCTVNFCDGDVSKDLIADEVLFCPDGRDTDYGKGSKRGEKPIKTRECRIGAMVLQEGHEVVAKFDGYRGKPEGADNPWFSGVVSSIDEGNGVCVVTFCDGDVSVDLSAEEVLYAPGREADFGKGDKRGALPKDVCPVRIRYGATDYAERIMKIKNDTELQELMFEKGVIIIFSADWCAPCQNLKNRILKAGLDKELKDFNVQFAYSESKELKRRYEVQALPTTVFLKKKAGLQPYLGANEEYDVYVGSSKSMLEDFRNVAAELGRD
mmetsp:Transcript_28420/g.72126  ORF Transcript_28420/g.72126 Transcript_28420/m.72126 type:complete len:315 (-) Transcript_28420:1060-2004(-)|eukprot:CAMPEP_0179000412 /NCGR_PEP_ID=MMETSP0795-20121207/10659_1 /TAXON_ID=88552 /ORGANISM="Amoebophrya sp., Strain Ameob2" /LENGTH=314 /DNA_ID=CAMNT_0020693409 /DNA_START=248 /DNA_END=1192 /DNA_ORIENTATION=-